MLAHPPTDGIEYNFLNLPSRITVRNATSDKGTISYIYDASGNKLEKRVHENQSASTANQVVDKATTYMGSFIYEGDALQFISH
jgi:hypothetical protein